MNDDLVQKVKTIEELYRTYAGKLQALSKKQDELLKEYTRALEKKKIALLQSVFYHNGRI